MMMITICRKMSCCLIACLWFNWKGFRLLEDGSLRIESPDLKDAGIFVCVAQNNAGTALGQVRVEVEGQFLWDFSWILQKLQLPLTTDQVQSDADTNYCLIRTENAFCRRLTLSFGCNSLRNHVHCSIFHQYFMCDSFNFNFSQIYYYITMNYYNYGQNYDELRSVHV